MKVLSILSRIFFPERCPKCKKLIPINQEFCLCCGTEEIKLSEKCCIHCGREIDNCSCGETTSSPLERITGVYRYEGLIQTKLLAFKFNSGKELYKFFGDKVSERVATVYSETDFDAVTFVPASYDSLKERGYNTAELIAKRVGEKLFLPCEEALVKSVVTKPQHILTARERMTNIKGTVSLNKKTEIKGKTFLLCDDVKTTGATLRECCDVLLQGGAKEVCCVTAAITSVNVNRDSLDITGKSN